MLPPYTAPFTEEAVTRAIEFFEQLSPAGVASLASVYAPQAHFKDPFNDVQGVPAIEAVFAHMFEALEQPRFVVTGRVVQGTQCFLTWHFLFAFKGYQRGLTQTVRGASHLVLGPDGRITHHRDYWDAAEELYEKLPLLGTLMRWLQRRARG
jgi:ketosteroid isomerase-like protein